MNTITRRLTSGFMAVVASAITLGAALSPFTATVHAADVVQVQRT